MTRATSEGLSNSWHPSRCRVCSSEGLHDRVGLDWFEAAIRARLIRIAASIAEGFIVESGRCFPPSCDSQYFPLRTCKGCLETDKVPIH